MPVLELTLAATWIGDPHVTAEHLAVEVGATLEMRAGGRPYSARWPRTYQPSGPQLVGAKGACEARVTIHLPWDRELIREIKALCGEPLREIDFDLVLDLKTHYRMVAPTVQMVGGRVGYLVSEPLTAATWGLRLPLGPRQWRKAVERTQVSAFEVADTFEVVVKRPPSWERGFMPALRELRDAEQAFSRGDWDATMRACRSAVKVMLETRPYGEEDYIVPLKGAEWLYARLMEGGSGVGPDWPQETLRGLLEALGLHEMWSDYYEGPRSPARHEEAELTLGLTLCLFRYLGHALARTRERDVE